MYWDGFHIRNAGLFPKKFEAQAQVVDKWLHGLKCSERQRKWALN